MQFDIPFIESLMPREISDEYTRMNDKLRSHQRNDGEDIFQVAKSSIETIRHSMEFLKIYCKNNPFKDAASEIIFFKIIKPYFHAHLIYWITILNIELQRPVGGIKREIKFLKKRLHQLYEFFDLHRDFYQYYRSGQTDRDSVYFVRNMNAVSSLTNTHFADADTLFSTSHDYLVAVIIANDRIRQYLLTAQTDLSTLKKEANCINPTSSPLQWTASKTGLVELIYALQSEGVFNHGTAMIQEIATFFQEQFDIKLVNYYHTFNEIRIRKKNRTALLESMREKLIQKMDELDNQ